MHQPPVIDEALSRLLGNSSFHQFHSMVRDECSNASLAIQQQSSKTRNEMNTCLARFIF
jgi:hypothetical protein